MMDQLSFLAADQPGARKPSGTILRSALIEPPYRWELRRQWGGQRCIGWIGLNPSIANAERDDPTMLREIAFSNGWGYGSLIKLNVYPFISPDPKEMLRWREGDYLEAFTRNIREATASLVECETIVAAWGAGVETYDGAMFVQEIERRLGRQRPVVWMCLGKNADGSPIHTLARGKRRVPDTATLQVWRDAA